jgi:hypothetical protein
MEKTLKKHSLSYTQLFDNIGVGNYLHVLNTVYSKKAIQTECSRQNKYAGCNNLDNKFTTSTTIKKGYITIFQRR